MLLIIQEQKEKEQKLKSQLEAAKIREEKHKNNIKIIYFAAISIIFFIAIFSIIHFKQLSEKLQDTQPGISQDMEKETKNDSINDKEEPIVEPKKEQNPIDESKQTNTKNIVTVTKTGDKYHLLYYSNK